MLKVIVPTMIVDTKLCCMMLVIVDRTIVWMYRVCETVCLYINIDKFLYSIVNIVVLRTKKAVIRPLLVGFGHY